MDRRRDWVGEVKHRFGEFSPGAVRAWQRDLARLMCLRPDVPRVEVDWERYAAGDAAGGGERALQSLRSQLVLRTGVDPETLAFNPRLAEDAWEEYNGLLLDSFLEHSQFGFEGGGMVEGGTPEEEADFLERAWRLPEDRRQAYLARLRPQRQSVQEVTRRAHAGARRGGPGWQYRVFFGEPRTARFLSST